jgi:hypothetical protein
MRRHDAATHLTRGANKQGRCIFFAMATKIKVAACSANFGVLQHRRHGARGRAPTQRALQEGLSGFVQVENRRHSLA